MDDRPAFEFIVSRELVEAPATTDARFSAFYREDMPRLVAFLRWQGVPLTVAVDLAQEAMVQLYQRWTSVDHPPAWVRRVASRLWARRIADTAEEDLVAEVASFGPLLGSTNVEEWEQSHHVLGLLDRLPPRQRQIMAWTLDGFGPGDIARELRIGADAVRSSLLKARRSIAGYLRRENGDG